MKQALVVLAQEGYQDIELSGTMAGLQAAGFTPVLCSKEVGVCTGKLGGKQQALIAMKNVHVADYSRVIFIGGPGASALADDVGALDIVNRTVENNIPLGAICIAPIILAKAKVLQGKQATVWDNNGEQAAILEQNGCVYTGDDVTVDGRIVTANGPAAAEEFGHTIASVRLD